MKRVLMMSAAVVFAVACNAILDLPDPSLETTTQTDASMPKTDGNISHADSAGTDAKGDVTTGCSSDLKTDPKNCGACGHNCLGAACGSGKCLPTPLVPAIAGFTPEAMALDGAGHLLFVSNSSVIGNVDLATGKVTTVLVDGVDPNLTSLKGITAGGGYVYFTNYSGGGGAVVACSIQGCATSRKDFVSASSFYPDGILLDGNALYFSLDTYAPNGAIKTCDVPTCAGGVKTLVKIEEPRELTMDTTKLYFGTYGESNIYQCAKAGCGTDAGAPLFVRDGLITISASGPNIYFSTDNNLVGYVPKTGASGPLVTANADDPEVLQTDATHVYWITTPVMGDLVRCPLAVNCVDHPEQLETLGTAINNSYDIEIDDTFVYYSARDDGIIWKVVK